MQRSALSRLFVDLLKIFFPESDFQPQPFDTRESVYSLTLIRSKAITKSSFQINIWKRFCLRKTIKAIIHTARFSDSVSARHKSAILAVLFAELAVRLECRTVAVRQDRFYRYA